MSSSGDEGVDISHGKLMTAIKNALAPFSDAGDADEVAFHLMEIIGDIGSLQSIRDAASRGEAIRPELIDEAIGDICFHWPYHIKGIRRRAECIRFKSDDS